jgi:beta-galactosidase/beta-glucuronidase
VVWYARDFAVPAAGDADDVLLHFGAVDFRATVWVNGQEVGHNRGGHVPFTLDVTPYLRPAGEGNDDPARPAGEGNRLVVRVEDRQDPHQPRGKQAVSGRPEGIDYLCSTGIWQSVWLEPVPALRIDHLAISTDPEAETIELQVTLHAPATGYDLEAEVLDGAADGAADAPRAVVAAARVHAPGGAVRLRLHVPGARRWSPDDPYLYGLRLRLLQDDRVLDQVDSYAGVRSVALRDGRFHLNGRPLYLLMALDQGYWPDGLYTAPDDAALRADVAWARRLGFNGARKHQKVEDPRWLYWCDRLGLLVWDEMAAFWEDTPLSRERLRREWREVVRRDANHPCVVAWVPFNESMGLRALDTDAPTQEYVAAVVADTRAIDPTRPVVDNSGWSHVDTDIADSHHYEPEAGLFRAAWEAFHRPGTPQHHRLLRSWDGRLEGRTWYGPGYRHPLFAAGRAYGGQPVVVSEWGGFFLDGSDDPAATPVAPVLAQRRGVAPDGAAFLARYGAMVTAFDSLPDLAGDCWTQLTDIEDEPNGLLTEDRRPKLDPGRLRALNTAGPARRAAALEGR